jgi:hypothetical protein
MDTSKEKSDVRARLRLFDQATRRQQKRNSMIASALLEAAKYGLGWMREDLYSRERIHRSNRPERGGSEE